MVDFNQVTKGVNEIHESLSEPSKSSDECGRVNDKPDNHVNNRPFSRPSPKNTAKRYRLEKERRRAKEESILRRKYAHVLLDVLIGEIKFVGIVVVLCGVNLQLSPSGLFGLFGLFGATSLSFDMKPYSHLVTVVVGGTLLHSFVLIKMIVKALFVDENQSYQQHRKPSRAWFIGGKNNRFVIDQNSTEHSQYNSLVSKDDNNNT